MSDVQDNFPPGYEPEKVWTLETGRAAARSRASTGPSPGRRTTRSSRSASTRCSSTRSRTPNGVEGHDPARGAARAGHTGAEYDAWLIRINEGDQFGSGFVAVNPNSKIPALIDRSGPTPIRVFESGAILLHLAEKFGAFLPTDPAARAECLSWLFWQMGSAPYLGGGFGHFYAYAPIKIEYAIDRFAMEAKRQLDVLDRRLARAPSISRATSTPSPTSRSGPGTAPWCMGQVYGAAEFLAVHEYTNVLRWADAIAARPAVQARAHGQPRDGRAGRAAPRAPRRERLRRARKLTAVLDGLPKPQRYWSAIAIWLAISMSVLDSSIANVALPTIAQKLNAGRRRRSGSSTPTSSRSRCCCCRSRRSATASAIAACICPVSCCSSWARWPARWRAASPC